MSHENVELAQAVVEAWKRGDWDAVGAAADFECDATRMTGPFAGTYRGDQMAELWADFVGTWDSYSLQADEIIDAGEHVVVTLKLRLTGREGIEVQARTAWVQTFHDGALARLTYYDERQEALEAVGLTE